MRAAGLKAIATVIESTAVLIKSKDTSNDKLVDLITARIRGVISRSPNVYLNKMLTRVVVAQKYILCQYNIRRSLLAQGTKITPGRTAPTVTALEGEDGEDWVAVSSMVEKKSIATVMDELTTVGATDILVLDIANSRTA